MRHFLIILFILLCGKSFAQPKVHIDTLIDFTKEDSAALANEIQVMEYILNQDEFWQGILNADFGCPDWRRLHHYRKRNAEYPRLKKDKHSYSNQEIHDLLWNGDDEIGEPKDKVINLKLRAKDYEQNKKGLTKHGGTNKNTLVISSNRTTRIHSKRAGEYACHLIHEYMHVLGFKHRKNRPSKTTEKCGSKDVALRIQLIAKEVLAS